MNSGPKLIIAILVGLFISGLFFLLLINPRLTKLTELNTKMREKQTELITLEQQIRAYKNAQSDLSKATRKNEILSAFLIREDLVKAVINLERGASLTGTDHVLDINEPDPSENTETEDVVEAKQDLTEIPYRVTSTNDFIGTVQFLQYLEHLPEFTEVSKINLSAEVIESEQTGAKTYTGQVFGSIDGVFFVKSKE